MSAQGPNVTTLQAENAVLRREIEGLKEHIALLKGNAGVRRYCKLCTYVFVGRSSMHDANRI